MCVNEMVYFGLKQGDPNDNVFTVEIESDPLLTICY